MSKNESMNVTDNTVVRFVLQVNFSRCQQRRKLLVLSGQTVSASEQALKKALKIHALRAEHFLALLSLFC